MNDFETPKRACDAEPKAYRDGLWERTRSHLDAHDGAKLLSIVAAVVAGCVPAGWQIRHGAWRCRASLPPERADGGVEIDRWRFCQTDGG